MKTSNKISVEAYAPKKEDIIIFDTNILIDIFYPINFNRSSSAYEKLYAKLLKNHNKLCLSSIQISEFINRGIRFQFQMYAGEEKLNFKKDYRPTQEYRDSMNGILDIVKTDIVTNFSFIDDGFSKMDTKNIFRYGFSYDFNDALIAEITRNQNAYLVTNDIDYANYSSELKLITNNKQLLKIL